MDLTILELDYGWIGNQTQWQVMPPIYIVPLNWTRVNLPLTIHPNIIWKDRLTWNLTWGQVQFEKSSLRSYISGLYIFLKLYLSPCDTHLAPPFDTKKTHWSECSFLKNRTEMSAIFYFSSVFPIISVSLRPNTLCLCIYTERAVTLKLFWISWRPATLRWRAW